MVRVWCVLVGFDFFVKQPALAQPLSAPLVSAAQNHWRHRLPSWSQSSRPLETGVQVWGHSGMVQIFKVPIHQTTAPIHPHRSSSLVDGVSAFSVAKPSLAITPRLPMECLEELPEKSGFSVINSCHHGVSVAQNAHTILESEENWSLKPLRFHLCHSNCHQFRL